MRANAVEFNHALIYVADLQRALRFYQGLLGLRVLEEEDGYARLQGREGTTTIGLHTLSTEVPSIPSKEAIRLYFEVSNLDEFCKELQSKGVKFDQPPEDMPWGWRHAYLRDPDGHLISLYWAGEKRLKSSEKTATTQI